MPNLVHRKKRVILFPFLFETLSLPPPPKSTRDLLVYNPDLTWARFWCRGVSVDVVSAGRGWLVNGESACGMGPGAL